MDMPTPPAPDAGHESQPPARAGVSLWTLWGVPLLCLGVTAGLWWQTHSQLRDLRDAQTRLAADLASMRNIPTLDLADAPALGSDDAVVTLIEFSDYECPYCLRHFTETMPQIASTYIETGRLRYAFRDFPIDQLHPGAKRAHQAAHCAGEQGRFWELHNRLFTAPGSHDDAALDARATEAGLDPVSFRTCLDSGRHVDAIDESVAMAFSLGASGTPFFLLGIRDLETNRVEILNGVSGAQPFSVFEQAIEAVEARVR